MAKLLEKTVSQYGILQKENSSLINEINELKSCKATEARQRPDANPQTDSPPAPPINTYGQPQKPTPTINSTRQHELNAPPSSVSRSRISKTCFPDGRIIHRFPDGTERQTNPDGSVVCKYPNGDVKRTDAVGNSSYEFNCC